MDASKGAVVYQRYCHVYRQGELEGLVAELGGCCGHELRVVEACLDTGNWVVVVEKGALLA